MQSVADAHVTSASELLRLVDSFADVTIAHELPAHRWIVVCWTVALALRVPTAKQFVDDVQVTPLSVFARLVLLFAEVTIAQDTPFHRSINV